MPNNFELNEGAIEAMHIELADNLELADKALREKGLMGESVDAIKPRAADSLASVGVTLPDEKLTEYAQSIADGEDYEFELS